MNKFVIVLFVAVTAVAIAKPLPDDERDKLDKLNQDCVKSSGVDEETLKKIEVDGDFPEDDKIKAHAKCIMKGLGVLDDDGKIDSKALTTGLKRIVPDGKEDEIVERCNIEKDSEEDTAFEVVKCLLTEIQGVE